MALTPPRIEPVPTGDGARPFWSVMIPTRDPDPGYLAEALASVLAQDPGPAAMEIVVVDDGSDRLAATRRGGLPGGNRVAWTRQPRHVGIGENWNACIRRARGRWVHILHQDDLVRPGFYERLREGIERSPTVGAAFCRDVMIGPAGERIASQVPIRPAPGIVEDWLEHVFVGLHLRASALVVRRSVYEALGGFSPALRYALDWDMWKRIAVAYPLWYEPAELACARRHDGQASAAFRRSGAAHLAEIRRSIELSAPLLPPAVAPGVTRRAREVYTRYAVQSAWRALRAGGLRASLAQLREARRLTSARGVAVAVTRLLRRAPWTARPARTS
ncbi:MAG TPA: glycosyltransferase [Methylomirabilota bacterium]|nr:glycosyltransferase [Methylomirabilota bacterium]